LALTFSNKDDVAIVEIHMPMTAATSDSIREEFMTWLTSNNAVNKLVIDLGEVNLMDSAGLGVLMAIFKQVSDNGCQLRIARIRKKPSMVFRLTRADRILKTNETVEEAVTSF